MDVIKDRLDAFLTSFLHTSDSSGPEEHLGVAKPPLVVHRLDGLKNDLGALLQVRLGGVHLLRFDDDETVDEVRVDSPVNIRIMERR